MPHVPKEDPQASEWLAAVLRAVDSSDPWRKQARAAMEARDWQALSKLLEGPPAARQSPVVLLGLTARNPSYGDPMALDLWRYTRQSYPSDFWVNLTLAGVLHYWLKPPRLEEAIRYYTAAIALRPHSPATYVHLGNALRSKGELDEAIAVYRQATAIVPTYVAAHERLGLALERKGCLDEAIAELRKTIRFRDQMGDHFVLGRLLRRKGRHDEAIASYRKGMKIEPSNAEDHNNLSWQLLVGPKELRDPKAALPLARKAVALEPQNYLYVNTLGVALYRNGEFQEAIPVLEKSLAAGKGAADTFDLFFLAMCYHRLDDPAKARDHYDRADAWFQQRRNKLPAAWLTELIEFQAEARTLLGLPEASSKK